MTCPISSSTVFTPMVRSISLSSFSLLTPMWRAERPYAEKMLREVPDTVAEYDEARRMLKFLDNFIPIPPNFCASGIEGVSRGFSPCMPSMISIDLSSSVSGVSCFVRLPVMKS